MPPAIPSVFTEDLLRRHFAHKMTPEKPVAEFDHAFHEETQTGAICSPATSPCAIITRAGWLRVTHQLRQFGQTPKNSNS